MFSDEEIIKALECCVVNRSCDGCCFDKEHNNLDDLCVFVRGKAVLDLINRQKAEIEDVRQTYQIQCEATDRLIKRVETARAEAIKEFAERLREHLTTETTDNVNEPSVSILYYADETIDQIAKELTEEKK